MSLVISKPTLATLISEAEPMAYIMITSEADANFVRIYFNVTAWNKGGRCLHYKTSAGTAMRGMVQELQQKYDDARKIEEQALKLLKEGGFEVMPGIITDKPVEGDRIKID